MLVSEFVSTQWARMLICTSKALLNWEQQQESRSWMYCMLDAPLLKLCCTVLYAGQVAFGSGHFHGVWMEAGTVPQSQNHREAQAIRCPWLRVLCPLHQLWVAAGTTCYMSDQAERPELFFLFLFVLSKTSLQCHISSTCHTVLVCSESNVCIPTFCWRCMLWQLVSAQLHW